MAFNGLAIYDAGVFSGVAEDVSDEIGMISPYETPLLDRLRQAPRAATNVLHEWLDEQLAPNTVVASTNIDTAGTAMAIHIGGGPAAPYLMAGAVIKNKSTGEYMQISAIAGNTVTVARGFGGTTVSTAVAGHEYFVISDAALEGADVGRDISRPRNRRSNYCQIFKKDIIVSGTMQSVQQLGGISSEYEHQKANRTKEALRDLEKAVIQGKISLNTIGSESAYRTFKGMWDLISTNATSAGTVTPSILDSVIEDAWQEGAGDLDLIVCDANFKRAIDNFNTNRVQVVQGSSYDENYKARVTQYESSFGTLDVMLNRWMPSNSLMVISTQRAMVVPLNGRTFQHVPVARTGDAEKGMIIGEYTLALMNQEGMAKLY